MPRPMNVNEFMFFSSQRVGGADLASSPAADVHRLRSVLLEMGAHEADLAVAVDPGNEQRTALAERLLVLRDLVALRIVGIEVVLPGEDGLAGYLAAECEPELDRPFDGLSVRDGQCSRMREADGARARVRLGEVLELAAAEHLRPRLQMNVDLEPDDRLPISAHRAPPSPRAARARCRPSPRPFRRGARADRASRSARAPARPPRARASRR